METRAGALGGLYLVVDPVAGLDVVGPKVAAALREGVNVLQVWNRWVRGQDAQRFVREMLRLAERHEVPVLVHENPELLRNTEVHGIHYDTPHPDPKQLRAEAGREIFYGVTCGNDLQRVVEAVEAGADYISFCAMFPSPSAPGCELVSLETVAAARARVAIPIFASGGVTPENAAQVLQAGADGIAIISGILDAPDPEYATRAYRTILSGMHLHEDARS